MSWNKDMLRAIARERGEESQILGPLLLAHERKWGRTEEDYPRGRAEQELNALLENQSVPLPRETPRDYPGVKQLRAYAGDKALSRAVAQSVSHDKGESVKPDTVKPVDRADQKLNVERERG